MRALATHAVHASKGAPSTWKGDKLEHALLQIVSQATTLTRRRTVFACAWSKAVRRASSHPRHGTTHGRHPPPMATWASMPTTCTHAHPCRRVQEQVHNGGGEKRWVGSLPRALQSCKLNSCARGMRDRILAAAPSPTARGHYPRCSNSLSHACVCVFDHTHTPHTLTLFLSLSLSLSLLHTHTTYLHANIGNCPHTQLRNMHS